MLFAVTHSNPEYGGRTQSPESKVQTLYGRSGQPHDQTSATAADTAKSGQLYFTEDSSGGEKFKEIQQPRFEIETAFWSALMSRFLTCTFQCH